MKNKNQNRFIIGPGVVARRLGVIYRKYDVDTIASFDKVGDADTSEVGHIWVTVAHVPLVFRVYNVSEFGMINATIGLN